MKEISIIGSGLRSMCRLCLSSGVVLLDIFQLSSTMRNSVADVITKRAAVQITRGDGMPNFICQSCYNQLEKTHQFLVQIENSDRALRRYFQQLYTSDSPIKTECSVQPFEKHLILNANKDIVKCESLELHDEFDKDLSWKENEAANFIQEIENIEEMPLKSEIKFEQMDDNLLIPTDSVDDAVNASSNGDGNEITCEDTKIDIGQSSEISCLRSANASESSSKCDDIKKNISVYRQKHKNANELKSYQCDICSKPLSSRSSLYYHKRTHTGKKPYWCNLCNKYFSRSSYLIKHKRRHSGDRPYQCNVCNKCFSQTSHLKDHKRIHTGEKPYQCDLCNSCFSHLSNLHKHKLVHTGERPYKCDLCNKCFTQAAVLNKHKRIHTGEKPYRCDICNKCFSQVTSLNKHKRIHTGEKPYQCNLCGKYFSLSSYLNKHKRRHTGEKPL